MNTDLSTLVWGALMPGVIAYPGEPVDGVMQGAVIGTYLHGPVLALNPALADHLLANVVGTLPPIDDSRAEDFRTSRLARAAG